MRGFQPQPWELVLVTRLPPGLLNGLPREDQHAIAHAIAKPIQFNGFDDAGRAELEFVDKGGIIHFIYVDVAFIRPVVEQPE